MRDKSGAQRAPAGSGLGILPANSGGIATQQRAPGHERPRPASADAARHGRLSAASTAPGADIPRAPSARAPGQYCQSAAPRAPGPDVLLATTARVLRHDRLSAAQPVSEHNRSGTTLAAASVPHRSHVSLPPAAGHDRSRRVPVAAGSPSASVTHPTTQEVQRLLQATTMPLLDAAAKSMAAGPRTRTMKKAGKEHSRHHHHPRVRPSKPVPIRHTSPSPRSAGGP